MIYKELRKNNRFLGAEITFTPVELSTVENALKRFTKVNDIHPTERIIAQLVLGDMEVAKTNRGK